MAESRPCSAATTLRLISGRPSSQVREKLPHRSLEGYQVLLALERGVNITSEVSRHLGPLFQYDENAGLAFGAREVPCLEDHVVTRGSFADLAAGKLIILGEQEDARAAARPGLLDLLQDGTAGLEIPL